LIQTGELSVDLASRTVALGGEEVHLTRPNSTSSGCWRAIAGG
jgi:hypothetical protein